MKTFNFQNSGDLDIALGATASLGGSSEAERNGETRLDSSQAPGGASQITGPGVAQFSAKSFVEVKGAANSVNNVNDYSLSLGGNGDLLVLGRYRWFGDPATGNGSW
jgi:hypothetical protein